MSREIHLWLREDGEPPKAIGAGVCPPGPGRVVAVQAARVSEARRLLDQRNQIVARLGREPSESDLTLLEQANPHAPEVGILRAVRVVPKAELVRPYGEAS